MKTLTPETAIVATALTDTLLRQAPGNAEKATVSAQFVRTIRLTSEDERQIHLLSEGKHSSTRERATRLADILHPHHAKLAELVRKMY